MLIGDDLVTRLRMAETIQAATKMIEQGHVRVGTETISMSTSALLWRPCGGIPSQPLDETSNY